MKAELKAELKAFRSSYLHGSAMARTRLGEAEGQNAAWKDVGRQASGASTKCAK